MVIPFKNSQNFIRDIRFHGWDAQQVERGDIALVFAPQVGGRILGCAYKGRELFFVHPNFEGIVSARPHSLEDLKRAKSSAGFRLYGGYKTWLSPQGDWPEELPFYELDSGAWEWSQSSSRDEAVLSMTSPDCRESGARIHKEITLRASNEVLIRQTLTNTSDRTIRHGLWDVTQLVRPGFVYAPLARNSKFKNGVKMFDVEIPDPRPALAKLNVQPGYAKITCDDATRFKFGVDSAAGWLLGVFPAQKHGYILFRKTFDVPAGAEWGHGCSAEIFNSDETNNLEMEVHGPIMSLAPGQSFDWQTAWKFTDCSALPDGPEELAAYVPDLL